MTLQYLSWAMILTASRSEFVLQVRSLLSIVYLDIPTEVSVEKDEGRRRNTGRGVGRKLIESMAEGVDATWKYLSWWFQTGRYI